MQKTVDANTNKSGTLIGNNETAVSIVVNWDVVFLYEH